MLGNNKERKKKNEEGSSIITPIIEKLFDLIKMVFKWILD
jgi:hypothetical protein